MGSRGKNFRRRADDDDDGNDNDVDTPSTTTTTTIKPSSKLQSTKSNKPQKQAPKLLSFADDEGNETPPRPSSSKSSHTVKSSGTRPPLRITPKDRLTPCPLSVPSNVQPQAGAYTKEALLELKKNTRTILNRTPPSSRPHSSSDSKPTSEPVIVLKGLIKPVESPSQTPREVELEQDDSVKRGRDWQRDDAETRLASMGIDKGGDSSGSFLDQAAINEIRARRERLRKSGAAAPDFISLDGGSNHGAAEGLSDEEPEFRGRIAMFGEKTESTKKGVFEDVDGRGLYGGLRRDDELEDEDEEDKIWEEEQVRKGLGKRMDDGSSRVVSSNAPMSQTVQQQKYVYPSAAMYSSVPTASLAPSIGGLNGATQGLDVMSICQQAEIARKALQENARRLKESHEKTIRALAKTDENLSVSLSNITALDKSLSAADKKYIFMQMLRDFVSALCDFLQHKAPFIEELEEQMQKLHEERASAVLERRAADNDDEMIEVEAAVNAAMPVLNRGGSSAAMIAAATSAAQAASAAVREQTNLPVKLDEFGRDINLQKRMDITRRAEARQRRKNISDLKRVSSMEIDDSCQRIEGESSTDESDSESTAYQSNHELLLQTADQIFSDATKEYSTLSVVKDWFERMKKDYSLSYRDAYVSLSVPAIFSPYVRLELLKWDPLHRDVTFDDMKWHSMLFDYGMSENGFSPDDVDANLVPALVEKIALPILHHEIVHCWDMLSTRETKNAVSATSLVTTYVSTSSEALGELVVAIRTRLADAVAELVVPTWSPLVIKAVPNAARVAAYQFGISIRLLRNICLWKEILALPLLEKLALDDLLSGKILPHVQSIASNVHDAVTRTERIIASLSGVWAGPSIRGERSHKLQPLVDYVMALGRNLEKKHVSESGSNGLARRLKKMLVELNEYDKARAISRTFNLREAL